MRELSHEPDFASLQLVRTSRTIRFFGRLTLLLLAVSIVAMVFLPWRQTAKGTGVVVALDPQQRPQPVTSAVKGVVSYVKPGLREGSVVEKDELLLRLTPFAADGVSQIDSQIMNVEAQLTAQRTTRDVAQQNVELQLSSGQSLSKSLDEDRLTALQKWEQSKNKLSAAEAELVNKRNEEKVAEEVFPKGIISRQELISKQQAAEVQFRKVLEAENAVEEAFRALRSKEEEIESKKQEIDIKNRTASNKVLEEESKLQSLLKSLSDLQIKRGEYDRLEVRAPRSGVIQQWYGLEGSDSVKEGDQLFVIVPQTDDLCVEMKISGMDMPLVHEGDLVRLQFEGWPAVQFVGWPSTAIGTFGGKVNRVYPTDDGKGYFRVVVTPDNHFSRENGWPDNRYLRQGVRTNGWILLKQVPLGYEIWRQLNGFPPVISDKEPEGKEKEKVPKLKLPKT